NNNEINIKSDFSSENLELYNNYVALGDSITLGTGLSDPKNEAFSYLIKNKSNCELNNFGIDGMNSSWLLYNLSSKQYTDEIKSSNLVTISIGSNDIFWIFYKIIAKSFNIDISKNHDLNYSIYNNFSNASLPEKYNMLNNFYTSAFSEETKKDLDNAILKYKKDFPELISKIKNINSNTKIIVLEYYNPYHNVLNNTKFNKLSEYYINQMNSFLYNNTNLGYEIAYIKDAFYKNNSTNVNFSIFGINFDPHPNKKGHEIIYSSILDILCNK
ncbi:MAG: hypothetical protein HFJ43_00875, partial [Clostridia bacterium]|nr:hypothetical protein [Clostridia bacterium]